MKKFSLTNKYPIAEIFESIQGEGSFSGTQMIFIRLAGCNLNCSFCDTNFETKIILTVDEILEEISQYKSKVILFTGGEPLKQVSTDFLKIFKKKGYKIHVESNGTINPPKGIDHLTISPKYWWENSEDWIVKKGDCLKIVYDKQSLDELYDIYHNTNFKDYYLQPLEYKGSNSITDIFKDSNVEQVMEIIKEMPEWKLSIQTQKILKVR